MYFKNENGKKVFTHGKEAWEKAHEVATKCNNFKLDVEYERIADKEQSCYNCRYRKWSADSFICLQK